MPATAHVHGVSSSLKMVVVFGAYDSPGLPDSSLKLVYNGSFKGKELLSCMRKRRKSIFQSLGLWGWPEDAIYIYIYICPLWDIGNVFLRNKMCFRYLGEVAHRFTPETSSRMP